MTADGHEKRLLFSFRKAHDSGQKVRIRKCLFSNTLLRRNLCRFRIFHRAASGADSYS